MRTVVMVSSFRSGPVKVPFVSQCPRSLPTRRTSSDAGSSSRAGHASRPAHARRRDPRAAPAQSPRSYIPGCGTTRSGSPISRSPTRRCRRRAVRGPFAPCGPGPPGLRGCARPKQLVGGQVGLEPDNAIRGTCSWSRATEGRRLIYRRDLQAAGRAVEGPTASSRSPASPMFEPRPRNVPLLHPGSCHAPGEDARRQSHVRGHGRPSLRTVTVTASTAGSSSTPAAMARQGPRVTCTALGDDLDCRVDNEGVVDRLGEVILTGRRGEIGLHLKVNLERLGRVLFAPRAP